MRDLRIALIGVGALGSALAEILVRSGIWAITLIDLSHPQVEGMFMYRAVSPALHPLCSRSILEGRRRSSKSSRTPI